MLPAVTGRDEFAALVIRTDFSGEPAWRSVCTELSRPWGDGDYEPVVHVVDDPAWSGATAHDVVAAVSADEDLSVVFLADRTTMRDHDHSLLAVAVLTRDECESDEEFEAYSGSVRAVPAGIHDLHANLSIANLDFADVADAARLDPAGVFRSF
ncbi:hypothetical protein AB0D59_37820 [Streptomyces sp. NPDC048417]|uniref:DUF6924 domain-containing protein n=1 Tax=Streptomyces sp. NPDC048417 TaxID=3155387 RepID=UPI00344419CC